MESNSGREIIGTVVSATNNDTLVIETESLKKHKLYGKNYKVNNRIKANCKIDGISDGDIVKIKETRPISKNVHFKVISKEK